MAAEDNKHKPHPGSHEGDVVISVRGSSVQHNMDVLWNENAEFHKQFGDDKLKYYEWYLKANDYRYEETKSICDGSTFKGNFQHKNTKLYVPAGWHYQDKAGCVEIAVVKNDHPHGGVPITPGGNPPPLPAERELTFHEYSRESTNMADGTYWQPGSQMHAYEQLAQSGLIPKFSEQYYALTSIAARNPVVSAKDSGLRGNTVLGNVTGNFKVEGNRFIESDQSLMDTKDPRLNGPGARDHDAMNGQTGFVGRTATGGREPIGVTGHIMGTLDEDVTLKDGTVIPKGTMVRDEDLKKWEFAHDGNYRITLAPIANDVGLPVGRLLGLPVGFVGSSPRDQYLSQADQGRYGLSQAWNMTSVNQVRGFDNLFTDEQALGGSAQESVDRVYDLTKALNARKEMARGLHDLDTATSPADKTAAAEHALIALRDYRDNATVKRNDAMAIPLDQLQAGVETYIKTQGVTVDQGRIAAAPRLALTYMPQNELEQLQDYNRLKDSRYEMIKPGQKIESSHSTDKFTYRTMNNYDAAMANVPVPELSERDMMQASADAHAAITRNPAAINIMADAVATNRTTTIAFAQGLHDMTRNPKEYGFASERDAKDFIEQNYIQPIANKDQQDLVRRQLFNRGDTSLINSELPTDIIRHDPHKNALAHDDPFSVTQPESLAVPLATAIRNNPDAYRDTIRRMTDPALHTGRDGRTDGARYGVGILQSIGSEIPTGNTKEGEDFGISAKLRSVLGRDGDVVRHGILSATVLAEVGASGRSVNAVNDLDRRFVYAQHGQIDPQTGIRLKVPATYRAEYDAGRSGSTQNMYSAVLEAADARGDATHQGAQQVAVMGLTAHSALAQAAIVNTLKLEPNAFGAQIAALRKMDHGKYDDLADALSDASEAFAKFKQSGNPKYYEAGVRSIGDFHKEMLADSKSRTTSLYDTAWNTFITDAGKNPDTAAWIVTANEHDAPVRDALLASVKDAITVTDNVNVEPHGPMAADKHSQLTSNPEGDALYANSLYAMPRDKHGQVDGNGWFSWLGIGRTHVKVNPAQAQADTAQANNGTPQNQAAQVGQNLASKGVQGGNTASQGDTLHAGAVLGTNPVVFLGQVQAGNAKLTDVQAVTAMLESRGVQAQTFGFKNLNEMAQAGIQAGDITVENNGGNLIARLTNGTPQASVGLQGTLAQGAHSSEAWGAAKHWLLLLVGGGAQPKIPLNGGGVGNCPPDCGGGGGNIVGENVLPKIPAALNKGAGQGVA